MNRKPTFSEHSNPSASKDSQFQIWEKSEDVAMHFNDLIINFRLKALGAVSLSTGLLGGLTAREPTDWRPFTLGAVLILACWLAVAAIDNLYYRRLLRGAVEDAMRVEKQSKKRIDLSNAIDRSVKKGGFAGDTVGVFLFYGLPTLLLCVFSILGVLSWTLEAG